jgi:DNA replication protein DnaC
MTTEAKNLAESLLNQFSSQQSDAELADRIAKHEAAERRATTEKILGKAGLPARHRDSVECHGEGWLKISSRLKARMGAGFIIALCGGRGTGKTQMAVSLAKHAAEDGVTVLYATTMDFFLDLKETWAEKRSEKAVIAAYSAPRVLILDEVQERGETAWEDRILNHLIDKRYAAMKDTLLITNQTKTAFLESIGPSVGSRIEEAGGYGECTWPSYRTHKQA